MSDRERLEKLRRLKELREKKASFKGITLPGGLKVGVEGPVAEDPKGFAGNALSTAARRVQQLGSKLPGANVNPAVTATNDEFLRQQESQPGGSTGVFLGDTVATLPFAGISKGVQAGRALAPQAGKLIKALTSRTAGAAAEGAAIGGLINDSATQGATTSVLLNTLGRGAGKLLTGPISKSDEAKALQQLAESQGVKLDLPVAVAAKNKLIQGAFGNILPSLPGAQRTMSVTKRQLQNDIDDLAARTGAPPTNAGAALGADIRSPSSLENRMAWALASATGTAPQIIPLARAASSKPVNKALLGEYGIQKKLTEVGKKIKPITEALRRVVTLEGGEKDE